MRPLSWVGFIALFLRGIICGRISADFNPSQENLIELVPLMGKEFYVSLEISVPSNPSSFSKFLEIEEDLISLSVKPTGVFVFKYFSNNAFTTFEAPFTLQTNTFYRIEFLQTKILDKVEVLFLPFSKNFVLSTYLKSGPKEEFSYLRSMLSQLFTPMLRSKHVGMGHQWHPAL